MWSEMYDAARQARANGKPLIVEAAIRESGVVERIEEYSKRVPDRDEVLMNYAGVRALRVFVEMVYAEMCAGREFTAEEVLGVALATAEGLATIEA
jgi:hypothetical protein